MENYEELIKEQAQWITSFQKRAYQLGFTDGHKAGYKKREEELIKMGMIDEAKLRQVEDEENLSKEQKEDLNPF